MLDLNLVREKPDLVRQALLQRQMDPAPVDQVLELDALRRSLILESENLKAERNTASKEIARITDPVDRQAKIAATRLIVRPDQPAR